MKPQRGFTLVEVLIALVIVALAVGALLGTITSSASNIIYLKDKTLAEWVALNRLTEIRISKQMPDKGKRTGNAEMGGARWQWEEEVIELPVKGMFRIDVRARPTGEAANDTRPLAQPTSQTDSESTVAGGDVDKLSWTAQVVGVVSSARSDRTEAIAAPFAGTLTSGGGNPGGENGTPPPGAPGTPGVPKSPPGRDR